MIILETDLDLDTIKRLRAMAHGIVNNLLRADLVPEGNRSRAFDAILTSLDNERRVRGTI